MSLACLDSTVSGTLKREIIEKSSEPTKTFSKALELM